MKSVISIVLLLVIAGCQKQSGLTIIPNKESRDAAKIEEIKADVKAKLDSKKPATLEKAQ